MVSPVSYPVTVAGAAPASGPASLFRIAGTVSPRDSPQRLDCQGAPHTRSFRAHSIADRAEAQEERPGYWFGGGGAESTGCGATWGTAFTPVIQTGSPVSEAGSTNWFWL